MQPAELYAKVFSFFQERTLQWSGVGEPVVRDELRRKKGSGQRDT